MRVLLVEDDSTLQTAVRHYFARESWTVDCAPTLLAARACLAGSYDAVVLDLGLPDGDGLSLLPTIVRSEEPPATLILTARDRLSDRIRGLDAGADDYLVKPFDLPELAARLRALARRRNGRHSPTIELPPVSIDTTSREVRVDGALVDLTAREYALTLALAQQPRRVLSRRQLEDAIYPLDDCAISNVVEVYISRLRRKLGRDVIETVRGMGYRWGVPGKSEP
ncbi:MAG: response regulator transcription factor [Burkholderiales bacterium]